MKLSTLLGKLFPSFAPMDLAKDYIRCPHCTTLYILYPHVDLSNLATVHCGSCANIFNGTENKSRPRHKVKIPKKINPFQPRLSKCATKRGSHTPHHQEEPVIDDVLSKEQMLEEAIPYIPMLVAQIPPSTTAIPERGIPEESSNLTLTVSPFTATSAPQITLNDVDPISVQPPHSTQSKAEVTFKPSVKTTHTRGWIWVTAGCLLIVNALALSFIWPRQDALTQNTLLRPWLVAACAYLPCSIPEYRDPSKLIIQQNQLTSDPNHPDQFQLHAIIQNIAPHAQPLANLKVDIKNLQGEKVSTLIFTPQQYIPDQSGLLLMPGETLHIIVTIEDQMPDIFSYALQFL